MAQNGIDRADFDPTLATLREGVVNVALDRATEEVDGWEKRLRAADDRELTPSRTTSRRSERSFRGSRWTASPWAT